MLFYCGDSEQEQSKVDSSLGLILPFLGPILISYGYQSRGREIEAMRGVLKPPEIGFQKPFVMNFGSNLMIQTASEPSIEIDLRKFISFSGYEYPVQIRFQERRLLISAEVRNEEGETVAKIVDNHWVVKEDVLIARDRNYNDYAFEVIDSDLMPVLQVAVQGRNVVYIGGLFYFPVGRMLVTPEGLIINPSSEQIDEYAKPIFDRSMWRHCSI